MKALTPAKSLTSEIRSALSKNEINDSVRETADSFSSLCGVCIERLDQCFNVSNPEEAVRLAEKDEPLIDSVEALERFPLFEEWVNYCEEKSIKAPQRIEVGSTERLIELYKEWKGSVDFLRKKYRDAAIRKDESVLLSCLGKILKIDPSDEAAKDETRRILKRHFRDELKGLDEIIENDDRSSAMAIADRLDQLPFDELKKGNSWEKAIGWLNDERQASDEKIADRLLLNLSSQCEQRMLEAVQNSVKEIEKITKKYGISLSLNDQETLDQAKAWIKDEIDLLDKEEKSKDVKSRFDKSFNNLEANLSVVLKSPLDEIENTRRKLTNSWAELEKIGLIPSGGISEKVAEYKKVLDSKILKLKKKKRRKIIIKVSSICFTVFFLSYYGFAQLKSRSILSEFNGYKKIRTARPFEKLLRSTETYNLPVAFLARMGPDLKKARGWLSIETDKYQALSDDIKKLSTEADSGFGRPISEYWKEFKVLDLAIRETANDLEKELNDQKSLLNNKWDNHRANYIADQRKRRRDVLEQIKLILRDNPEVSEVSRDEEYVQKVHAVNNEFDDSMKVVIPPAFILDEIKDNSRSQGALLKGLIEKIDAFREVVDQIKLAKTYSQFKLAFKSFKDKKFEGTPEQLAANKFLASAKEEVDLIGDVVIPGQSESWKVYLQNRNKDQIFPKGIEEAERVVLSGISGYRRYLNLHKCFFLEIPSGKTFHKFCDGPTKLRNRKVGPNSIVERSGYFFENTKFEPLKFNYFTSGKFELKDQKLKKAEGVTLSSEEMTPESELFNLVLPSQRLMSQSQQYYKEGVLGVFDEINQSKADPLFKSYLAAELSKAVLRRPHQWGLLMAPNFMKDLEELQKTKPPILGLNDWMVDSRYKEEREALLNMFSENTKISYVRAAKVNRALAESVIDEGFEYAGYTDYKGSLVLLDEARKASVLYGASEPSKGATALYRKLGVNSDDWKSQVRVNPFTPLIYFKGDRKKSFQMASKSLDMTEDELKLYAVPFFLAD